MVIIVMGVSGPAKRPLHRHWRTLYTGPLAMQTISIIAANVQKMRSGIALTDKDREPWLRAIRAAIEQWKRHEFGHVLACSALKESYREILGRMIRT